MIMMAPEDDSQIDGYVALWSRVKQSIRVADTRKNFLLAYQSYTARRNFVRTLHLEEL